MFQTYVEHVKKIHFEQYKQIFFNEIDLKKFCTRCLDTFNLSVFSQYIVGTLTVNDQTNTIVCQQTRASFNQCSKEGIFLL